MEPSNAQFEGRDTLREGVRGLTPARWVFVVVVMCFIVTGCGKRQPSAPPAPEIALTANECAQCHQVSFNAWRDSDHALANRTIADLADDPAFAPPKSAKHGSVTSSFRKDEKGKPVIHTLGPDGTMQDFRPDMILARRPLRQYLVPFPGGRWQTTELAFDPEKHEWFDVYGDEDRRPEEWGFWTNRGMNWNSNCAFCHTTSFQKNYDLKTDAYHSTWSELGVSCAQCHGAMPGHASAYQRGGTDAAAKFTSQQIMENCASCHSRREQMTSDFKPGDRYDDHFRIQLPDDARLYYPDGQIRDEVFVYGSFSGSKMGHAGVTCLNCHDPHSNATILPVADNSLCMSCHGTGSLNAKIIDPTAHSHHQMGSTGHACVECHMTHTTYMQRDPRRDHGFIIPDPLLTRELGIPNACNKCHTDQSTDWAVEWTGKWYGDKMERPERERTRAIAAAQAGDATSVEILVAQARKEPIPTWQATLLSVATPWTARDAQVRELAREFLSSESPVVRSTAVRALGSIPEEHPHLQPLLDDPVRLVRLDAEWALRGALDPTHREELLSYLQEHADQPNGVARLGQMAFAEGRNDEADTWYRKAIAWDRSSPAPYLDLAMMQNAWGQTDRVLLTLSQAEKAAAPDAGIQFSKGLAYAERGQLDEAEKSLAEAVRIDPGYARAWYNLGLLLAGREKLEAAANTLAKAEAADPRTPDYPYALATVHARRGDVAKAREAAGRAVAIAPGYPPAVKLLQSLPPGR